MLIESCFGAIFLVPVRGPVDIFLTARLGPYVCASLANNVVFKLAYRSSGSATYEPTTDGAMDETLDV